MAILVYMYRYELTKSTVTCMLLTSSLFMKLEEMRDTKEPIDLPSIPSLAISDG